MRFLIPGFFEANVGVYFHIFIIIPALAGIFTLPRTKSRKSTYLLIMTFDIILLFFKTDFKTIMETSVGKSVFILTDAFNDYNNLNNLLRVEGHSVVYLSNSINAVQQIIENVPDFILCDFHLKNPISLEILQTLQKIDFTASIPFVLIGSPIKQQEILDLILLGAQNYIVKPFETHYLFLLIKREFKKREYIANSLIQKYQVFYHNPFDGFIILHDYQFFFAMILSLKCWGLKRMNCQNSPLKI